jgi:predicted dehydrogenase
MIKNPDSRRSFIKKMSLLSVPLLGFSPDFNFPGDKKLRIALVGLGRYAGILATGIKASKHCVLTGIVTGTPAKAVSWAKKYKIPKENIYNYENFDTIVSNQNVDVIYIVLPNGMHKEFAIRAAKAGKHVIVEKPLATTAADAQAIIDACAAAKVQLAVGYRLHFEPYNMELKRLGQNKVFGQVRLVEASLGYNISAGDPKDWHLNKDLGGGGPLQNLGVYCIQAGRYILGEEPVSVTAQFGPVTHPTVFVEVEESIQWQLHFKSGAVATSTCSYAYDIDRVYASADEGNFELSPAISYGPFIGKTSKGPMKFPEINQQATQLDAMAGYLLSNKPFPSHIAGQEGFLDLKVIDAIYKAAESGKRVMV